MINTAIIPVPKLEEDSYDWYARHEDKCIATSNKNYRLIFIGDSITHFFEGHPSCSSGWGTKHWKRHFTRYGVLNLGFGWDRTQNVLYRLQNGEFVGQTPELVVINIGTNNLTGTDNARTNSPEEIHQAHRAIIEFILNASPNTHILLMGVFPRSNPKDQLRKAIQEINALAKIYADESESITFIDIWNQFLDESDSISTDLMSDLVHPTTAGYKIWADAIIPILEQHMT